MTFSDLLDVPPRFDPTAASDQSAMPFELRSGALVTGELRVRRIEGREAFSECFRFDLEVATSLDPVVVEESVLGRSATLIMRATPSSPRSVTGVIASVRQCGPIPHHGRAFRLRLVPTMWLLKRRRNTRIFQDLTIVAIISAILDEAGITYRFSVEATYTPRAYVVQYRESDYDFVVRLAREAGLFFFFERASAAGLVGVLAETLRETVVFGDGVRAYPPIEPASAVAGAVTAVADAIGLGGMIPAPALSYRPAQGFAVDDDTAVTSITLERTLRPTQVTVHDYDYDHPLLELRSSVESPPRIAGGDTGAVYDPKRLEVYDEHYDEHVGDDVQARGARTLLDGYRAHALRGEGISVSTRLAPGHRFSVDEHPDATFNREHVVATVRHRGFVPANLLDAPAPGGTSIYENRFTCLPAIVPARQKPRRRAIQQVVEVATVVGPKGEEIHTDALGRIKVQFPWDRDGKRDERSSCWIRVSQNWAGSGFGGQFIPRIGMEVLVTFLGGEVDRPVVTGCLYNATHPPSFELPADKTRSGLRTQSSPGGGGYNELSFEDEQGKEQIRLHAQRDLDEEVLRNHTLKVENDEIIAIARNRSDTVVGNRERVTKQKESTHVVGDQSIHVEGGRTDLVDGAVDVRVKQDLVEHVGGSEMRETTGASNVLYRDDRLERVQGSLTTLVGLSEKKRAYALHVEGAAQLTGTTVVEISSDKSIVLRVGKSTLRLSPDGIELSAASISVVGKDSSLSAGEKLVMKTKGEASLVADKMLLKSSQASVALGKEVKVDGSKILLNSPSQATDAKVEPPPPPTEIELVDEKGKPLPNQRFLATYDDGTVISGFTDDKGKAVLPNDGSGTLVFPDVSKTKKL